MVVYPLSILAVGGTALIGRESKLVVGVASLVATALVFALMFEVGQAALEIVRAQAAESVASRLLG